MQMRYRLLGNTGLRVSEVALGTMTFGEDWGWGADRDESQKIFDGFAEAGGTFIDTANLYTNGTSEQYVGDFVSADREHFVIATKYTLTPRPRLDGPPLVRPNESGNSRKSMVQSVEASLDRLGTDYIDLLYIHAWDYLTPVEEVVRAMDDLVRAGKVLYVAASDTPAYIVSEAITLARLRGWTEFSAMQAPYSLMKRDLEREIMPMARHHGITVVPWGILHRGVLTGKFSGKNRPADGSTRLKASELELSEVEKRVVAELVSIAEELGQTPAAVAVNWTRSRDAHAQMIPLLGARTLTQLEQQLSGLFWELSAEHVQRLDAVSQPDLGFPHDFLPANRFVFGHTFDLIDDHRGQTPVSARRTRDTG